MYSLAMLIEIKSALETHIEHGGEACLAAERSVAQAALTLTTVLIGNHLFAAPPAQGSASIAVSEE